MAADAERSRQHYRDLAASYDHATRYINGVRLKAIAALQLSEGDSVIDAGCGTGFCLPHLARAVGGAAGSAGRVIGFEHSPEMLDVARERVRALGLSNVILIEADTEHFQLPAGIAAPTAVLFSYVHDVMNSKAGLDRLLSQTAAGARVAACSTKLFPAWFFPGNLYLRWSHREYITNFDGFETPWQLLSTFLYDFSVTPQFPGSRYIATGRVQSLREHPATA